MAHSRVMLVRLVPAMGVTAPKSKPNGGVSRSPPAFPLSPTKPLGFTLERPAYAPRLLASDLNRWHKKSATHAGRERGQNHGPVRRPQIGRASCRERADDSGVG